MSDTTQAPFTFAAAKPKIDQTATDPNAQPPKKNGRKRAAPTAAEPEPKKKRKTRQRKADPLPAMIRAMNELPAKHQARVLVALQEIFG